MNDVVAAARYAHAMPFGAALLEDGRVRFRLWAPAARRVQLALVGPSAPCTLEVPALEAGWFELITDAVAVGSRYRYRIDERLEVPDPASRFNPDGVHGASMVIDPHAFTWPQEPGQGRPWHTAVVYELHAGTFSPEGTFAGIARRLDHLAELGITVIEIMPIAQFPGRVGWGYDGVLPFAPHAAYGTPEELKALVAAAHARGLAVMLDVVYNHFGPEGNYLHTYAPQFFSERHHTPWGPAINFDGPLSRTVRDFFIHNALYWLTEYRLDGLRLDAVHAIRDDSAPDFLTELARSVRAGPGRQRPIHLVLENAANQAHYLAKPASPDAFDAQWNDDEHHCLHVIVSGERDGYYRDYAERPHPLLCRCLAEGFAFQGEPAARPGDPVRGESSAHLPPTAFVPFLQNHDQIGNRAFGERLSVLAGSNEALRAVTAILLLAPSPPLLFMGQEWGALEPFPYFCDLEPELAAKVREGRRREFARFARFADESAQRRIPDASARTTFESARLDWGVLAESRHADWLAYHRRLLAIRRRDIVPLVPRLHPGRCVRLLDGGAFAVDWRTERGRTLHLLANLTDHAVPIVGRACGRVIFATHPAVEGAVARNELAPWSATWLLERSHASR
jgi:malto-oligosyltrehalose trehalohydrolase